MVKTACFCYNSKITFTRVHAKKTSPNGTLRRTLFIETSVLLGFAIILTVVAAFFLARNETRSRASAQVQSIIHAKEELLESVTSSQREQVAELAKDTTLTRIPTVTNIIGFQGLFTLKSDGTVSAPATL